MITTRLFLDTRRPKKNGLYQLKIVLSKNGSAAMHSLGIDLSPEQWNNGTIVNHPEKRNLQACVSNYKAQFDRAIFELTMSGKLVGLKASEAMRIVKDYLNPELVAARQEKERKEQEKKENFYSFFEAAASIKANSGTRGLYLCTLKKIEEYYESIGLDAHDILFQDIKRSWLEAFEMYCLKTEYCIYSSKEHQSCFQRSN